MFSLRNTPANTYLTKPSLSSASLNNLTKGRSSQSLAVRNPQLLAQLQIHCIQNKGAAQVLSVTESKLPTPRFCFLLELRIKRELLSILCHLLEKHSTCLFLSYDGGNHVKQNLIKSESTWLPLAQMLRGVQQGRSATRQ